MRKLTKNILVTTALITTLSTITPILNTEVSASSTTLSNQELSQDVLSLSEYEITKFNPYIELNEDNSYSIKKEAIKELTSSEYEKINSILSNTNQIIKEMNADLFVTQNFEIKVLSPQDQQNQSLAAKVTYKEGISDVTFHWWGMTIYLSKTLANKALAAGITLGGIWIPSKVIASVGAMLGLSDKEFYKGGIWIDQFWIAGIGPVKELFGFDAFGYQ